MDGIGQTIKRLVQKSVLAIYTGHITTPNEVYIYVKENKSKYTGHITIPN